MPAVIDTGGPRVLHCVERAVCPAIIPSALAIVVASSSSSSFSSRPAQPTYPVQQEEKSRFTVDKIVQRRNNSITDTLRRSSITQTRLIPGNDERDEFFIDERSSTLSTTSSNDLGCLVARSERRHCAKDRKRYDELRRRRINRTNSSSIDDHAHRTEEFVSLAEKSQNVPEFNETVRQCERLSSSNNLIENEEEIGKDRQRTWTRNHHEKEPDGSTKTSPSHLKCILREDHWDGGERGDNGRSSDIVMRLFGNLTVNKKEESMYPRVEESSAQSAAISSQRVSNCVEYEWPCECECFSRISNRDELGSRRVKSEMDRTTRERRKTRHRSDILHKGRSYVQLLLLIFLIAFGHGSLFKSKFGNFGVKSTSIGAGLGVLTIGTIIDSVRAVPLDFDAGVRAERSANLSHITGASRKIMIYIKHRHLQILPDGTVNGSDNDISDYTIFQRISVSWGQLIIQSVATCLYLCMDSCGLLYGSRKSTENCVFNETLEKHNYNTYSSVKWSTPKKNLYIGLNRHGQPRRVQAKGHNLGRLSGYASALPRVVSQERVETLYKRMMNSHHNLRHHKDSHHHRNIQHQQKKQQQQTICPDLPPLRRNGRGKCCCNVKKNNREKKRQCKKGDKPGGHCKILKNPGNPGNGKKPPSSISERDSSQTKKSCGTADNEETCKKQTLDALANEEKIREENNSESQRQNDEKRQNSNGKIAGAIETVRRKRPGMSLMGMRRKINGRVTRITVAAQERILGTHLPSSWFPGEPTTPSMEINAAPSRRTSKTAQISATQNSITSDLVPLKSTRMAKSLNDETQFGSPASSTLGTNMDDILDEHSIGLSYITNDSSLETSDETISDESLQQDYDSTMTNIEYSTIMTTMDTTPPERTENYTRAMTTQSIHP